MIASVRAQHLIAMAVVCVAVTTVFAHAQQSVFRAGVDLVSVEVAVRNGRVPVADLGRDEFRLTDNGVVQQIEALSTEAVPIDVSLLIDTSASALGAIDRMKSDVQKIANLLRPVDRLRLVTFARTAQEVFPMQAPIDPLPIRQLKALGGTSLNDTMLYALAWPSVPDRRHLIVVCTDGEDSTSVLDDDLVPALASRSDAVLHVVLFKPDAGPGAGPRPMSSGPPVVLRSVTKLREAATVTGGETIALNDAVAAFRTIIDDFRRSYVLRYTLRGVKREGWHDVAVTVTRTGGERFTVRARKGYFGS